MANDFIEVTDIKMGAIHRVNVAHIISFVASEGVTVLLLAYKYTLNVKETPEQILSKMKELQNDVEKMK